MNNTAILDENGIATVAGDITVYHYDEETREYTSSSVEYLALGVGTPAHSCIDVPPEAIPGYVVCRTATLNGWEHVPDHRGETVYSTENGTPVQITQPGDYPEGTTTKQPGTVWDIWNGEKWVTDTERQRTAELATARQQRQERVEQAIKSIDLINLKLRTGRSLTPDETAKLNAVLDYIDELNAMDISTAPEISWPEAPQSLAG
ncbi:tail fiber assembly protein [Escherichia coli]|nr:tail fiber assembly protein [Escherichia coli]